MVIIRFILFIELLILHWWCRVQHNDFKPRNVLFWKRWFGFGIWFGIIDFALAQTDHACPGWDECEELTHARRALGLWWLDVFAGQSKGRTATGYAMLSSVVLLLLWWLYGSMFVGQGKSERYAYVMLSITALSLLFLFCAYNVLRFLVRFVRLRHVQ